MSTAYTLKEALDFAKSIQARLVGAFDWDNEVVFVLATDDESITVRVSDEVVLGSNKIHDILTKAVEYSNGADWGDAILQYCRSIATNSSLSLVTDTFLENLSSANKPYSCLFIPSSLTKRALLSRSHYSMMLSEMIGNEKCLVVAGDAVFCTLFEAAISTVDIFVHGVDDAEASRVLESLVKRLQPACIVRTNDYVAIVDDNRCIKVSLSIYKDIEEVLLSFDVDSYGLGFDGKHFLMTERAKTALELGTNTVDFNKFNVDYEQMLLCHAHKGMSVFVPDHQVHTCTLLSLTMKYGTYKETNAVREMLDDCISITAIDVMVDLPGHYNGPEVILNSVNVCKEYSFNYICGCIDAYEVIVNIPDKLLMLVREYLDESGILLKSSITSKLEWKRG